MALASIVGEMTTYLTPDVLTALLAIFYSVTNVTLTRYSLIGTMS